eukprot:12656897-Alexandrium_andersonii.AAC.1
MAENLSTACVYACMLERTSEFTKVRLLNIVTSPKKDTELVEDVHVGEFVLYQLAIVILVARRVLVLVVVLEKLVLLHDVHGPSWVFEGHVGFEVSVYLDCVP